MEYVEEPEERAPVTPEEYLAERKASMRTKSWVAVGVGSVLVIGHIAAFAVIIGLGLFEGVLEWSHLFRSIFFLLGLFAIAAGAFGLREANRLTFEDLVPSQEAIAFSEQIRYIKPWFSYTLVGSLVAVFLAQQSVDSGLSVVIGEMTPSILRAGLIKSAVTNDGEWWRLLTGASVHGGLLHMLFNGYALYGFGNLIEYLSNRAHLAIVMLLSMIGASLASLVFMPQVDSVGASGGIMGLIGYLAVYGLRRRRQLMPGFLRAMLTNIGFIAAFGLVGYQIIDNFAHFGGLAVGLAYGFLQVPVDLRENPRKGGPVLNLLGYAALGAFIGVCLFSIFLIRG